VNTRFAIVAGASRSHVVRRLSGAGLAHIEFAGVDVFSDAIPVTVDRRGPCLVIGKLFRRSTFTAVGELGDGLAHAIADSGGRYLIDHCWGSYIALTGGRGAHGAILLRDPSAQLPLYRWALDGCDLYFNDFQLACDVSGFPPTYDWEAVAHRLRFPGLRIAETGLSGISEILPGSRVNLDTGAVDQLWRPWDYAERAFGSADPAMLAATIDACTSAWARSSGRIDVELSGGLDSSIVAASVAAAHSDWRCVTYATDAAAGDERSYARSVAQRIGVQLEECVVTAADLDPLALPKLRVRPGGYGVLGAIDQKLATFAHEGKADAIFSGGGGDNVFCKVRTAGPVVDALLEAGPRKAWRTALDLAVLCETSPWDALRHTRRQWARRSSWSWPATDTLLDCAAQVPCRGHPWLDGSTKALPGKRAHIAGLVGVLPFLDGYDRAREFPMIFPLLSQPVVEACLSVPSWRWIEGGRDRAYARDAFAARLPDAVIRRRSKGGLRSIMVSAFERSRSALVELLCGGRLADRGLIDRRATLAMLQAPILADSSDYVRIFELCDVELWVRSIDRFRRVHR
jgi:asparagine synthase (glutamine-hydrolysing)